MVPLICAWEYFPEKRGIVTGIVFGAFGLGAFVFSFVAQALINPDGAPAVTINKNKYWEKDVADRVPSSLRILCAIWLGQVIVALLLIKRRKVNKHKKAAFEAIKQEQENKQRIGGVNASNAKRITDLFDTFVDDFVEEEENEYPNEAF